MSNKKQKATEGIIEDLNADVLFILHIPRTSLEARFLKPNEKPTEGCIVFGGVNSK